MKILILGIDGYLGWTLAQYLAARGHEISGIDNFSRRENVKRCHSDSAIPIAAPPERFAAFQERYGKLQFFPGSMENYNFLAYVLETVKPDAIVHFAEIPSAPYSMIDQAEAAETQYCNVIGTLNLLWGMKKICPDAHLIKIGTMGELGQPNFDIPEGYFEVEYKGRKDTILAPRMAGSFYHLSKVHDTFNIEFACRTWGLRSTDIMQGVVYGTRIDEMGDDPRFRTRFDIDDIWGTCINRYCAQAVIGMPLTVYGKGGQTRGFLALRDSMQCLTLALENPPKSGESRVFNQFDECYSVEELAYIVQAHCRHHNINVDIQHVGNPRKEKEEHYYNPEMAVLLDLGFEPTQTLPDELSIMMEDLLPHRERIESLKEALLPRVTWEKGWKI